jgi:hypothetical protein
LLDFVIQASNSLISTDAIERLTLTSFTGFATDVGFTMNGGGTLSGGTVIPETVSRGAAGDVIGFNFSTLVPLLFSPGSTTFVLVIKTNATEFTSGTVSEIDGGVAASFAAFAPNGVPEVTPVPTTLPLLATGLGALGLLGWRRKRKAQAVAQCAT